MITREIATAATMSKVLPGTSSIEQVVLIVLCVSKINVPEVLTIVKVSRPLLPWVPMALLENKKVRLNYEILDTYDAGIELLGFEVKSIRKGQGSLEGAYAVVRGGEAFLLGTHIPPYQPKNMPPDYDPRRTRRLLLTKKEIATLAGVEAKKGLTIVPISLYNKGRKIKVELAVVRGKKKFDKRETLKRRDAEREIRREIKEH